eukprot:gnl/TRDRNA2_/TRDRNA2_82975_c1_seq1.p1 gnl/TRDRNA2_/TRDRNA2_82975_c1~~gnl/TRDRNA2_/TRDRNA2_82975_c1_seq1.p1  ORF type:complete len:203 (-),score=50.05 gnl/TRDRNA2_/TRDRNA2_82975_c1_seq1:41-568(-)
MERNETVVQTEVTECLGVAETVAKTEVTEAEAHAPKPQATKGAEIVVSKLDQTKAAGKTDVQPARLRAPRRTRKEVKAKTKRTAAMSPECESLKRLVGAPVLKCMLKCEPPQPFRPAVEVLRALQVPRPLVQTAMLDQNSPVLTAWPSSTRTYEGPRMKRLRLAAEKERQEYGKK